MTKIDLSEFEALMSGRGPKCGVCEADKALPPAKRAKLNAALESKVAPGRKRITNSAIRAWLLAAGFEVSANAVSRHRRKECRHGT